MFFRDGTETLSVAFMSSEKRASWEESFIETKLKLRGKKRSAETPTTFTFSGYIIKRINWLAQSLGFIFNFKSSISSHVTWSPAASRVSFSSPNSKNTSWPSVYLRCSYRLMEYSTSPWRLGLQQWRIRRSGKKMY